MLFDFLIDLYFLIPAVTTQNFNPISELAIPVVIPTKETKEKMETHPVILEIKISKFAIQFNPHNFFRLFSHRFILVNVLSK